MSWWYEYGEYRPPLPADGIRAKTGKGKKFGQTWWGDDWIAALERLVDPSRLQRGRSYARRGQVLNVDVEPGQVFARVQGSRPTPYEVRIRLEPLDGARWDAVADAMAGQAIFAAKLLAGEMPRNIEEAFQAAGVSLFPARRQDLITSCSCPDWANPCKHVAAAYYLLGEQFDEDPFLLFRLRGRGQAAIMDAVRERRAPGASVAIDESPVAETAAAPEDDAPALEDCLESFWRAGAGLSEVYAVIEPPPLDAEPVKRRGEPPFWQGDSDFLALMSHLYASVTRAARDAAYGE